MQFLNVFLALEIHVLINDCVIKLGEIVPLGPKKSHKLSLFFFASSSCFLNNNAIVKLVNAVSITETPLINVFGSRYPISVGCKTILL